MSLYRFAKVGNTFFDHIVEVNIMVCQAYQALANCPSEIIVQIG